jgi:hypothetical protein
MTDQPTDQLTPQPAPVAPVAAPEPEKAPVQAPVAPAPQPAPVPGSVAVLLVERWWQDWFPSSPVSRDSAAWNHAYQAKEDLKKRLAK